MYDLSSQRLEELCGLRVSDTTIREIAQRHGTQAKALHTAPAAAHNWTEQARRTLLSAGWPGIEALVQEGAEQRTEQEQAAVDGLLDYLAPHQDHLSYAQRLASGQSIGSGQIEGACKNLIGRRLKANAARWRTRRINRMAGLCSLLYSHQWQIYWETP